MLRFPSILAVFLLLFFARPALGELYTAEVPAERGERTGAAEQLVALDRVLARLTGRFDRSLIAELGIGGSEVGDYVLSQQLVQRPVVSETGESEETLRLQVEFDEPSVNELLRSSGLPRWGRERPAVLLWAVIDDEEGARFLDDARMTYLVSEHARRLGLDVLLPLRDALDLAEVSLQDVRGGFLDSSVPAARRYGTGVIAMFDLRLLERGDETVLWNARWRWRIDRQEGGFDQSGERAEALLVRGLQHLASALAARYAVVEGGDGPSRQVLAVGGIVDEVQFAEVLRYLENLSVVESARVIAAREREIVFELQTGGTGVESYLELGGLLVRQPEGGGATLHYRLAR